METNSDYKIPLGELLTILKANGYEVSVERILEIQSVLLSAPVSKMSLSELKFIVTPVLARNDEDQNNIYKIIDAYIADKVRPVEKKPTGFMAWFTNRRLRFVLKVAGFLLIVVTAVWLYLLQKREPPAISVRNPPPTQPADSLSINTTSIPSNDDTTSRLKPSASVPHESAKVEYNGKPIVPVQLNIMLQAAAAFGLGFGGILYYFIFYERKRKLEAAKKVKEEEEGFAAGKSEGKTEGQQSIYAALQFPDKNFLIQKTREFSITRANLKKAGLTERMNLHVKESVSATTRNAGLPSLVFDNQWKERRYLILLDNKEPDAHITHLLNFVVNFLESSKIPISKYYYTTDIRRLHNKRRESISLEDLSYDFADYHLIIIGDCNSFFMGDTTSVTKDLDNCFRKWMSKSIITPTPLQDWTWREEQLQNSSFHIVPAEINAIELLTKAITEESPIKPAALANCTRTKYSVSKYNFNTAGEVREYLDNEELFQVICSLAVYPRLNWNITLALFAAILKKDPNTVHTIKPDYDTLLKISRIPWLNAEHLDESIRLQLFEFLNPETEVIARETIIGLLQEINPFVKPGSKASKELQVQLNVNSFFLYAHDPQQYKEYAAAKNEFADHWKNLEEWALKERVKNGLMPVNSKGETETVEEFVLKEEQFERQNVTFLRIALLVLPAALLYILFSLFKPSFTYLDSYEKVSFIAFIQKDSSCKKEITKVIVGKLDKFDTTQLKKLNDIRYIQIDNTEYNRSVNLSFLFADSTSIELPVVARDSTAVVSIKCR